jgi:hypothetical protein
VGTRMSFRDAIKNNYTTPNASNPSPISFSYIVENVEEVMMMEIIVSKVKHLHSLYEKYTSICRCNGY